MSPLGVAGIPCCPIVPLTPPGVIAAHHACHRSCLTGGFFVYLYKKKRQFSFNEGWFSDYGGKQYRRNTNFSGAQIITTGRWVGNYMSRPPHRRLLAKSVGRRPSGKTTRCEACPLHKCPQAGSRLERPPSIAASAIHTVLCFPKVNKTRNTRCLSVILFI